MGDEHGPVPRDVESHNGIGRPPAFRRPGTQLPAEFTLVTIPGKPGSYRLVSQFEFEEPAYFPGPSRCFRVPPNRAFTGPPEKWGMATDLASIPFFATWLVPKDGKHTPAALVHDAQVNDVDNDENRTVDGPYVTRDEADSIFRRGMQELGVAFIRRWLMWAAVSIGTRTKLGPSWRRWWWWIVIGLTVVASLIFNLVWVNAWFDGSLQWAADLPVLSQAIDGLESTARWVEREVGPLPDSNLQLVGILTLVVVVAWGRRMGTGLLAAAAVMLLGYPMLVAAWSFLVYWILECLLECVLHALKRVTGKPGGPINAPGILKEAE